MSSKSFLKIFSFSIIFLCALTISVNVFINPYGYYGDQSLGGAYITNAHIAKYNYLKNLKNKPNTFILGSSNAMRFTPKTIDSALNLNSFNFGVYQASIEDFYCISKVIIEDLNIKPKLMFICIDDWNFSSYSKKKDVVFTGAQNRLAYKTKFSKHLKDYSPLVLYWSRFKTAISIDQTITSLNSLKESILNKSVIKLTTNIEDAFYKNGVRKKYANLQGADITEIAQSGKYDVTKYLNDEHNKSLKNIKTGIFKNSHEDFNKLQPERLNLLIELVEYLQHNNVKIIFNIMPLQPFYKSLVIKYSNYNERMSELIGFLTNLKSKYNNVLIVKDNSDISNFNGDPSHFFDHIHPTSINSDLMIFSILKKINKDAF